MTQMNENQPVATRDLDEASLDAVVGAGIMVPDLRKQEQADKLGDSSDTASARKQEESDKLGRGA